MKKEPQFGQYVKDFTGKKGRFIYTKGEYAFLYYSERKTTAFVRLDKLSPDPDPPELVRGQPVFVCSHEDDDDWQGPYPYGVGGEGDPHKHFANGFRWAKAKPDIRNA